MKLIAHIMIGLFCIFMSLAIEAKNLGHYGEVYPIVEEDMLDFIYRKMYLMNENGEIAQIQQKLKERAKEHIDRPAPIEGITRAAANRSWSFDPSIRLAHDIVDQQGNVIAKAGSNFNPLSKIKLHSSLIFYNGDEIAQVKFVNEIVKKFNGAVKLVLVKGSISQQLKYFHKRIYFDQRGSLTTKFGIVHVPAIVQQAGQKLQVTEYVPNGD